PQWSSLRAPGPRSARLAVDTEHGHILFVDGEEGLYRSTDAGESWSLVLPVPPGLPPPYSQWTSAVSPADPAVVYATASYLSSARVWRSPDGGTSWEQLRQLSATLCGWSFPVVEPDPVVRERVYLAYGCLAGRTLSIPLRVSQDLWATDGETIFSPPPSRSTDPLHYLYPRRVAFEPQGRHGLLGADRDARLGGSVLARTDDGGTSWRPLLAFLPPPATPPGPHARVADFVAELPALNRLFVGLAGTDQGVLRSEDGGTIWRRLGSAAIGPVNTLAVDWSAGLLYAGTTRGLWLLPLP
ncbi:MAG TPA: hypothetical protein VHS99_09915, partial [Chloroflexota bacterium]|nr:hypothetical protein [Chloroflexota bacterium]